MNQLDQICGVLMESKKAPSAQQAFLNDMPLLSRPPITSIACSEWTVAPSPERFVRTFVLDTFDDLIEFVTEIFAYERDVQHNAKLIIDSNTITIEVFTHGPNCVTELDIEYRNAIDSIHEMLFGVIV